MEKYFDMSDEELQAIAESENEQSDEAIAFVKEILIKREAFREFSNQQLRLYMKMRMYDETDKKVMQWIIDERTFKPKVSSVSFQNGEREYLDMDTRSIMDLFERQARDIHTLKNCAVFFVILTILGMVFGFAWLSKLIENLKIY